MNLRFTPPVLVLALSIGASARVVSKKLNIGSTLADRSSFFQEHATEKFLSRRRAKSNTASIFDQEAATGRNFYNPDVGILQGKTLLRRFGSALKNEKEHRRDASDKGDEYLPRFLQVEVAPLCGTNGTCPHKACACRANGGDIISDQCAPVFNSLCNGYADADGKEWNIDGCINDYQDYPGLHEYMKTSYCLLSQCFAEGGTYGSCACQAYQSACEMIGDERPYNSNSTVLGFCAAATCCQNKTDEAGRVSCTYEAPSRGKYRQEHPRCGTNGTCYPGFCDAYVNAMGLDYLAAPFNAICNGVSDANGKQWEFDGCYRDYPDYPDYQLYAKTAYCETSKCLVAGGSYGTCICQGYKSLCEVFGDVRNYNYDPDEAGSCKIDACCQSKTSEAGRMTCFELTNSTPTTSPTSGDVGSNPPAQNSSSTGADATPDAITGETPTNEEPPSSSSPSAMSLSTIGTLSSFVAASAVLSVFN